MFTFTSRRHAAPLLSVPALLAALTLTLAPALAAQTLSGSVSDGNGGPLLSGQVYLVTSSIVVPTGTTLTVQPGAVVKFNANQQLAVQGTLNAGGTLANPVHFTSFADDSVGGDTNGDGASVGTPGDWRGLQFQAGSDASALSHAVVAYGGASGFANVEITTSDVSLSDCVVRDGAGVGIDLNNSNARPTVSDCAILDNGGVAVDALMLAAVAGFVDNSATGNGRDAMEIDAATQLTADLTITADNVLGGALIVNATQTIPAAATLTLGPGVALKFADFQQLVVNGTLVANGASGDDVVFTALADDATGGDTNGDGASVGTPGAWRGLFFQAGSDASALSHAVVAYGGASGFAGVEITTSDVSLSDCVVRDGAGVGIDLNNSNARPMVSDCAILDNGGVAVDALMLAAVPGFVDNVASGNGRDAMEIDAATQLTADLTITADNVLGGALIVNATQTIPAAATLTLGPGVALKFADFQQLVVNGTLVANGASGNDVVFTALADDATGGDTNGDGASVGTPGAWRGLFFQAGSDASALSHAVVAYGGASGFAGVEITTSDVSLSDCVVRDGAGVGIDLNNSNARPTVSDCAILDNGGVAVDALMLAAVPGFVDNVASGNGRDAMEVDAVTQITSDVTIGAENTLGGVLVVSISQTVPAAKTLTVSAGVVLKFAAAQQLAVNGGLVLDGDPRSRVVFTSIHDDEIGGDSNGDGVTSTPMPGDWRGLILSGAATGPVALANTTVTYGGASGFASVANSSPLATLRAVRVEHADADGFDISQHAGILRDCVAFACQGHGFDLISGSYDLRGCSSVDNGGAGYRAAAAWTGEIRNSIAWDNVGAPFAGLVVNDVFFSNGEPTFSGTNGNRHLDPKFVDQTNGNLRLSSISGLIDVGDFPYLPSGQDADGFPRDLDGLLDGVRRTDIGAHEFSNLELEVIGAPLAGGTISVELSGTPGLVNTNLIAGLSEFEASFKRFGNLFVDLGGINTIFAWPSAPSAVPLPLPIELPIGLEIHLQAITFTGPMPSQSAGNLSNPITLTVE